MQTPFCQLRKLQVSASKNMLMQPKLELASQGLSETILTSAAQHWEITWNFQNNPEVGLRGQLKSNSKMMISSWQESDEYVAINHDR